MNCTASYFFPLHHISLNHIVLNRNWISLHCNRGESNRITSVAASYVSYCWLCVEMCITSASVMEMHNPNAHWWALLWSVTKIILDSTQYCMSTYVFIWWSILFIYPLIRISSDCTAGHIFRGPFCLIIPVEGFVTLKPFSTLCFLLVTPGDPISQLPWQLHNVGWRSDQAQRPAD